MKEKNPAAVKLHERFSVECFNKAWDLIARSNRSPDEDEKMLQLSYASLWHWSQRPDCEAQHLSMGYWQLSHIFALLKRPEESLRYGTLCLNVIQDEEVAPYLRAYAHEALARAEAVAGNAAGKQKHLAEATQLLETIEDADTKQMLRDDLATIP